jgi:hypothetical protein
MPSLIPSLLGMRCPVCRQGAVFKNPNPFALKSVGDIYPVCLHCGQNFRPEPGFYFGGAVISYPLTVLYGVLVVGIFYLFTGDLFNHFVPLMVTLSIALVLVSPLMFRYSRIIFLYVIFKYRGKT